MSDILLPYPAKTACSFGAKLVAGVMAYLFLITGLQAQVVVQEYYIALPEAQIRQNFLILASNTGTTLDSVISVTVGNSGTKVIYDHWEDGYEVDLNNPAQATTKIWGDGNNANGIAPGFANDPSGLSAGAVLALRNLVTLPRNASTILYDGRDRLGATNAVVVSRSAWATTPGSVLADATEVYPVVDWGTSFVMPVGEDVIYPTPLTSSMFEKVSLFVQAAENGTQVQIDLNGDSTVDSTVTLNRGEVHFTASGVQKGATVTTSKPVQVHLMTGDVGANYESRWFAIPPQNQWGIRYYSAVGTASNGHEAYAFLYNPNANAITINYNTRTGSGSFSIPARDTYRHQLPQNSGIDYDSISDQPFFGVGAVGAKPSSNNVYDWGFTLVPQNNLTTALVVGWGPGTSDLSQNGSPAWVTALTATRIYVDYDGDHDGALTDPTGQNYDAHYDIAGLESMRLYDPDKDQTAMRIYTLDGTLVTGAWGQDPAVAGAGNPYLDVGTTIPAYPAPVMVKTSRIATDNAPAGLSVGDVLEYIIRLDNKSLVSITSVPVLDTLPVGVSYVTGSTTKDGSAVADAGTTSFPLDEDGLIVPIVRSREFTEVKFLVAITASGTLTNTADVLGYPGVRALNTVNVPSGGGSTSCALQFTNSSGSPSDYLPGQGVYVTLTDADANTNSTVAESVQVVVTNGGNGDAEFVTLVETGVNTGVFRNTSALTTSTTAGLDPDDGTLNVQIGNTLSSQYLDPQFADTCSDTATINAPGLTKQLYLDTDGTDADSTGDLDRVDPVATTDATTSTSQSLATGASATFTQTPAFASNFNLPSGGTVSGRAYVQVPSGSLPGTPDITAAVRKNGTPFATLSLPSATLLSGGTQTISVGTTSSLQSSSTSSLSFSHNVAAGDNRLLLVSVALGATSQLGNPPSMTSVTYGGTAMTLVGSQVSGSASSNDDTVSYIYRMVAPPVGTANVVVTLGGNGAVAAGATTFYNVDQTTPLGTFASAGGFGSTPSVTVSSATGQVVFGTVAADENPTLTTGGGQTSRWLYNAYGPTSGAASTEAGASSVTFSYSSTDGSQDWAISAVPVRPASSDAIYQLDWSATLGSATTAGSGDVISVVVQNNVAATPISLLYDSQTYPARIDLPTTTVIDTLSVSVYDAAYPAGGAVTGAAVGSTVYVRVAVTDPFGTYDITSSDLVIDGPGTAGDVSTTLGGGQVVSDNGTVKTYEYAWATTATQGSYSLTATSKEGYENTIQSSKSSSFTLTELDLGTPSTTVFNKDVYAADEIVCITTTDLDQNQNPAVAETVLVTVQSSSGDSEIVMLTETGVNTGAFSFCVTASSTTGGTPGNGTLHAPVGSVLTVTYVDPDDSSDTSGDTASVPTAAPSLSVVKTLLSPVDGQAMVGESVQYRLRVTNTGGGTLSSIQLTDSFPALNLAYASASVTPDSSGAGSIVWNNVGPLTSGQSTDIVVSFTALASAAPAVNSVLADAGGGLTASDTEDVIITSPSLSILKTLVSPNPGPAGKGDDVIFDILVQNTGDTLITTVPLEDSYSSALFDFVSATTTPDGEGGGSLVWTDITGTGGLAVGESYLLTVTLRAKGAANPATNHAAILYAVDVNGDPVAPVDSTASLVTEAASIRGTVYDDDDGDDVFSAGDTALQGVVVRLYTDPDGDGDPADGTLVDMTTTLADGSYEFLNLDLGDYVVVEEDILGYVSLQDTEGDPNDNRIRVGVSSFIAHVGKNFLDAVLDTSSYGSISGQVRDDTDADGSLADGDSGIASVSVGLYTDPNGDGSFNDGILLATTLTNGAGAFSFTLVPPGGYVVVETDPAGYVSTADVQNPNDNRIALTLPPSGSVTGNDFLDSSNTAALGSIGDSVWLDTDNDGVRDLGESLVDGVVVELYTSAQTPAAEAPYLSSTTASGGAYLFTQVPAGSYVLYLPASNFNSGGVLLSASLSSSVTVTVDDGTDNDDNGIQAGGAGTPVSSPVFVLAAGETDGSKDFGFVPDGSFGSISGVVMEDTTNDLVGEVGIGSVTVAVYTDPNGDGDPSDGVQWASTTTAPDGSYDFFGLPPGDYVVEETQPAGFTSVTDTDGGTDNRVAVSVVPAGSATADFIERQVGEITGSVFADLDNDDFGDVPLFNVTITLKDAAGDDIDSNAGLPGVQPTTTTTDIDGNYAFTDLLPGTYRVVETQPAGFLSAGDTDGGVENEVEVVLTAGGTGTADFVEEEPAMVGNLVWQDANNDGFKDVSEDGIDGVMVELLDLFNNPVDGDPLTAGVQALTATTSGGGAYGFTNLPPGLYRLRISTPPSGLILSSSITNNTDDGQDDDDNGSQVMPGAHTYSPVFELVAGDVESTLDFGFTAAAGTLSISGQVRDDYDLDGSFSDSDQPVLGVTVRLYADSDSDGVFDAGDDLLVATTMTDALGAYSFDSLLGGTYFVQEVDPVGATSTADVMTTNDNLIRVLLAGSSSIGNDFLDAVDPAGYAYDVTTGQIIPGGSIAVSGPGVVTLVQDGSSGQYSFFIDGTAGTYTITYTPPSGYIIDPARPVAGPGFDPTGGSNPTVLGAGEDGLNPGYLTDASAGANPWYLSFDLASGDPLVINNNIPLRLATPKKYQYWKLVTPGGGPDPGSNGDGDCYIDLVEYALNLNPSSGVQTAPVFRGVHNTLTGKIDVSFDRVEGGLDDVSYTLMGLNALSASPAGWTALSLVPNVTSNGDGTETVTFEDVEDDPYFTGLQQGFVRLKVELDEDGNMVPEETANTPAFGWTRRTFDPECVMTGHPYLKDKLFCGTVDAVVGNVLDVTTSAGSESIAAQLLPGRQYFIEVFSGDNAGHRFELDEAATTAATIALDAASSRSTQATVPASLAGDKVVIREHHTLNDLFPTTVFNATNNAATADRLMFMNRGVGTYSIYWLLLNGGSPKWVLSGDGTAADQGGRAVDPVEGWYTHPRSTAHEVVWHGMVRANAFACPLVAGPTFVGSGYPMDQSPAMRGMTTGAGFIGTRDPSTADQLLFWKGYTSTQAMAYYNHFLLSSGPLQQWTEQGNALLTNENNLMLFKPTTGAIYRMRSGLPNYVMPLPWTP